MKTPQELDYRFARDCPRCGETAGWNGGTSTIDDLPMLELSCPNCGYDFAHFSGRWHKLLKSPRPPTFTAGASR